MRSFVRTLVVVVSVVLVLWTWRELRARRAPALPAAAAPRPDGREGPLPAADLIGIYQGPIQRADSSEEWLVLEIVRVDQTAGAEVTFAYTLTSASETRRAEGRASLRERWIRFGGLSGEMRRRADGVLILRSVSIEGPPNWMLERPQPRQIREQGRSAQGAPRT